MATSLQVFAGGISLKNGMAYRNNRKNIDNEIVVDIKVTCLMLLRIITMKRRYEEFRYLMLINDFL